MTANNITILDFQASQQTLQTVAVSNVHTPVHLAELWAANNYVTNSNPVPINLTGQPIQEVGFLTYVANTFTRPNNTTAYSSGQLVANSTTNTSVVAMAFAVARTSDQPCRITRGLLSKSSNTTSSASFRLHLYANASPTVASAAGDGGTWLTNGANTYMGWLDCTIDKAFSDGALGPLIATGGTSLPTNNALDVYFVPSSGTTNIYGLLEARGAYTPAALEVFTVKLFVTNY